MSDGHDQECEYPKCRKPIEPRAVDPAQHAVITTPDTVPKLPDLLRSSGIGAGYNAPVRAQGMQQMQRTHGNRAVQRALNSSFRTTCTSLRPVQRGGVTDLAKDVGKGVWNSKYNPLRDPVDDVIGLFGGNSLPSVYDIIAKHQLENERKMILIRNKEQIEKEYGPAYFSMLMTNASLPSISIPQAITDMDQRRQQQEHDASIESAQKALTGEIPGAKQGAPGVAKPDEIYPDMVSK